MNEKNYLRLIAAMLAEIHQQAEVEDGVDSKLVASALWHRQDWAILWEHDFLLESEDNPKSVDYVVDVLNMWRMIESDYERLDQVGKERVAAEVPYDAGRDPKFGGFDGNNEAEYRSIAMFLIESMNRFEEFNGRNLNTHSATTHQYESMLQAKREIDDRNVYSVRREPSADDLIAILGAPYK